MLDQQGGSQEKESEPGDQDPASFRRYHPFLAFTHTPPSPPSFKHAPSYHSCLQTWTLPPLFFFTSIIHAPSPPLNISPPLQSPHLGLFSYFFLIYYIILYHFHFHLLPLFSSLFLFFQLLKILLYHLFKNIIDP